MPKREVYTQNKNHAKQLRKQREADNRQAKYDSLTIAEKLATLIPNGSNRQRTRLQKQLESQTTVKPTTPKNAVKKKK